MVVGIFASLAGIVNVNLSKTKVDGGVFQLHYRVAASFCFIGCTLVAISDFIGEPIHCLNAHRAKTTLCWVSSIYTIINDTALPEISINSPSYKHFSGTGNENHPEAPKETLYHSYYQWVPFILFLQGCLFYLPHFIWKNIEGKKINNILQDLGSLTLLDDSAEDKKKLLVSYLFRSRGLNQRYWYGYFFCECLNLVSVITQAIILNEFFDGVFWNIGFQVLNLHNGVEKRTNALLRRFPRITKCIFKKFGPSGTIENESLLCVLPQNLLNEKIFLIMWIVLMFLIIVTVFSIILRVIQMNSKRLRLKTITMKTKHPVATEEMNSFLNEIPLGDYYLLLAVGRNVGTLCFRDIIEKLANAHYLRICERSNLLTSSDNEAFHADNSEHRK